MNEADLDRAYGPPSDGWRAKFSKAEEFGMREETDNESGIETYE